MKINYSMSFELPERTGDVTLQKAEFNTLYAVIEAPYNWAKGAVAHVTCYHIDDLRLLNLVDRPGIVLDSKSHPNILLRPLPSGAKIVLKVP